MKNLMIVASLMFAATAQAQTQSEQMMEVGVDVTPIVAEKAVVAKYENHDYALENVAAGGQ
jgi:hypothetical protein